MLALLVALGFIVIAINGKLEMPVYDDAVKKHMESIDETKILGLSKISRSAISMLHTVVFEVKTRSDLLKKTLDEVSDYTHPNYGKYLNQKEVADLISIPESNQYVKKYLEAVGVTIDNISFGSDLITATSTVQKWEDIFGTVFHEFELTHPRTQDSIQVHRALSYSLPNHLVEHVTMVHDLIHFPMALTSGASYVKKIKQPTVRSSKTQANQYMTISTLNSYYKIVSNAGSSLVSQAFFQSLNYKYNPNDITTFQNYFGVRVEAVTGNIGSNNVTTTSCSSSNCDEPNLDAQYLMAVSQITPTYCDYYQSSNSYVNWVSWITSVNALSSPPYVISVSYGSGELTSSQFSSFDSQAQQLGVKGVTLIASSGDSGAHNGGCGYTPTFPATSQYFVAVGATMGPETGTTEIACSVSTGSVITSGGGFSNVEAMPSYQSSFVSTYFSKVDGTSQQPVSGYGSGRGYPDVALAGNDYEVVINGYIVILSGTSASAPVYAGMVSLVNAIRKEAGNATLGWMNPLLYSKYPSYILNDITSGNNLCQESGQSCCTTGFYCASGWDPVTGLGSINYQQFVTAMSGTTVHSAGFSHSIVEGGSWTIMISLIMTVVVSTLW